MLQAIPFKCSNMKCRRQFRAVVLPFKCSCGAVYQAKTEKNQPVDHEHTIPCIHRGPELRDINCGCNGKPKVYKCEIHGECALRMLPKMPHQDKKTLKFCIDCDCCESA